jgi:hypothetical protein
MYVRAFDGQDWSQWDSFTFTALANSPPVATISDHSLHVGDWAQIKNWISYSDANGDAPTQYEFWDGNAAAGSGSFWTPSGGTANPSLLVSAADLNGVYVGGAANASSETMYVRAFDGRDWGQWDSFTLTALGNTPPIATIADHGLPLGEWAQIKNWISYLDVEGNAATQYQFWDGDAAANSARFWTPSGGTANPSLLVSAADLGGVYVGGATRTGTETMYVRAFDGHDWSAWDAFLLTI